MIKGEIKRTATLAFVPPSIVPIKKRDSLFLATGTVAGALDASFSTLAELELFRLPLVDTDGSLSEAKKIGGISIQARFQKLTWSPCTSSEKYNSGIICGGLENGSIELYNPDGWLSGYELEPLIARYANVHHGPVKGLEFNPNQPFLLASGATEGEFIIWDLNKMERYNAGPKSSRLSDITCLGWNRLVPYVVALSSTNGSTVIFDLRAKKDVLTLTHPDGRFSMSSVAWSPENATQMVVSSESDAAPAIYKYDMRNAQAPELSMRGHDKGVLSVSWCPKDPGMLISGGKDNRHICWNPYDGRIIAEFPSSANWIFDVQWCSQNPAIAAACSFDGTITLHDLLAKDSLSKFQSPLTTDPFSSSTEAVSSLRLKNVPNWLKCRSGVSFTFGGRLICFNLKSKRVCSRDALPISPIIERVDRLNLTLYQSKDFKSYCVEKAKMKSKDNPLWGVMSAFFDTDPRHNILAFLGFTHDAISDQISHLSLGDSSIENRPTTIDHGDEIAQGNILENENSYMRARSDSKSFIYPSGESESDRLITRAIVMGDFETAVNLCLNENRLEDAFMLATCMSQGLVELVHDVYLDKRKVPFIRILRGILSKDITSIVEHASLEDWKDVLAMICTASEVDKFNFYCEILARRLEEIGSDKDHVIICNLCAGNVTRVLQSWLENFDSCWSSAIETDRNILLLDFMERYELLLKVADVIGIPPDLEITSGLEMIKLRYSKFLSEHGRLQNARIYIASISIAFLENLRQTEVDLDQFLDRLAYGRQLGDVKPSFPEDYLDVFATPFTETSKNEKLSEEAMHSYYHSPPQQQTIFQPNLTHQPHLYPPRPTDTSGGTYHAPTQKPYPVATEISAHTHPIQASFSQPSATGSYYGASSNAPMPHVPNNYGQPGPPPPSVPSSLMSVPTTAYHDPPYVAPKKRIPGKSGPAPIVSPFANYSPPMNSIDSSNMPVPMSADNSSQVPAAVTKPQNAAYGFAPLPFPGPPPVRPASVVAATLSRAPPPPEQDFKQRFPPGDRSQIPVQQKPIVDIWSRFLYECKQSSIPQDKRVLEDCEKRLNVFFDKLNNKEISETVISRLMDLTRLVESREYRLAAEMHVSMMTSHFEEVGPWMIGIKRIIDILSRH